MKKNFLLKAGNLLVLFLLVTGSSLWAQKTATLPFTENFSSQATFDSYWTIVDANNDGTKWYLTTGSGRAEYKYNGSNAANDYLISPGFYLYPGKAYKLTYKVATYNTTTVEKMDVRIGQGVTANDQVTVLKDYPSLTQGTTYKEENISISVSNEGYHNISFRAYSDKNQWYIYLKDVSLTEVIPLPGTVTGVTVTPGANKTLTATLNWTNPSLNHAGSILNQVDFTKLEIYRDAETDPIHTVTNPIVGATVSWTDETVTTGIHTYKFVPYNGSNKGTEFSVTSAWIGGGLSLPYSNLFTASDFAMMSILNNNNDSYTWELQSGYARYNYSSINNADDYLFTPPIVLHAGRIYKLTFEISCSSSSYAERMKVKIGKNCTVAGQDTELADYSSITNATYATKEVTFSVSEDTEYYLSFYCYSLANKRYLQLKNVQLIELIPIPGAVTDVTVTPGANKALTASLSWKNPSLNQVGGNLDQANLTKLEIYRDAETEPVHVIENPVTGALVSWTDAGLSTAGIHRYKFIPYNGTNKGAEFTITSAWIGGGLNIPYANTLSTADKFTEMSVLDNNGDNNTWSHNSSGHARYSYSTTKAADDYLFTPPLKLNAGSIYKLSFQSSSYTSSYIESLRVKIGKEATVAGQNTELLDFPSITWTSFTSKEVQFSVDDTEDYYISFYCYSPVSKRYLDIKNIEITEIIPLPGPVTQCSTAAGADKALTATLSWTNPIVNHIGTALSQGNLTKLEIYRGEETTAIHIIENPVIGASGNWTDENIPANGKYTYKLVPYNGTNQGIAVTIATPWIGRELDLPYTNNFSTAEFSQMTVLDNNNDTKTWSVASGRAQYNASTTANADDYLFTPPFRLLQGNTYQISYLYSKEANYNAEKMKVFMGTDITAEAQTIVLKESHDITFTAKTETFTFTVDTDSIYYLSFYCHSDKLNGKLYVSNLKIVELPTLPGKVTGLTALAGENNAKTALVSWTNPAVNTTGGALAQKQLTKLEIYRNKDANPIHTINNPEVGQISSWQDTNVPANGLYSYKLIPYNGINKGEADSISIWVGGGLDIPYINSFTEAEFKTVTVVDANADNKTWAWKSTFGCAKYDFYSKPDDWMIFPKLEMKKGVPYIVSFNYKTEGQMAYTTPQNIVLTWSKEKGIASHDTIEAFNSISYSGVGTTKTSSFIPDSDGAYYLGLHLIHPSSGEYIWIQSFKVIMDPSASMEVTSPLVFYKQNKDATPATIAIQATHGWEASTEDSWINLSGESGTGNGSFTFTCEENTGNQRSGTIRIDGAGKTVEITVFQSGKGAENLQVVQSDLLSTNLNISWEAPAYTGILFNIYKDGVLLEDSLSVKEYTDENLTVGTEYCYRISILYPNETESVKTDAVCATVIAAALEVSSPLSYLKNNKDTAPVTIQVESNVNWTAIADADWITINNGSGSGNGSFSFSWTENTGDQRNNTIHVTGAGKDIGIIVAQSGKGAEDLQVRQGNLLSPNLNITWEAPGYAGILFNIYKDGVLLKDSLSVKEYTDQSLAAGTEYCYQVSILYPNKTESAKTSAVCGTIITAALEVSSPLSYLKNNKDTAPTTLQVESNVSWTATTNAGWITINNGSGSGNGSFSFSCTENTGNQRKDTIHVSGAGKEIKIAVAQSGKGIDNLRVIQVDPKTASLKLSWEASDYEGILFKVYRDNVSLTSTLTDKEYTDNTIVKDVEYCYTVSILYPNGTESTLSGPVCATATQTSLDKIPVIKVTISPNPVSGQLKISSEEMIVGVRINDTSGRLMLILPVGEKETLLDVSGWSKGMYVVLVETESGIQKHKIVKE